MEERGLEREGEGERGLERKGEGERGLEEGEREREGWKEGEGERAHLFPGSEFLKDAHGNMHTIVKLVPIQ